MRTQSMAVGCSGLCVCSVVQCRAYILGEEEETSALYRYINIYTAENRPTDRIVLVAGVRAAHRVHRPGLHELRDRGVRDREPPQRRAARLGRARRARAAAEERDERRDPAVGHDLLRHVVLHGQRGEQARHLLDVAAARVELGDDLVRVRRHDAREDARAVDRRLVVARRLREAHRAHDCVHAAGLAHTVRVVVLRVADHAVEQAEGGAGYARVRAHGADHRGEAVGLHHARDAGVARAHLLEHGQAARDELAVVALGREQLHARVCAALAHHRVRRVHADLVEEVEREVHALHVRVGAHGLHRGPHAAGRGHGLRLLLVEAEQHERLAHSTKDVLVALSWDRGCTERQ